MSTDTRDVRALAAQGVVALPDRILDQDAKAELAESGDQLIIREIQVADGGEYGPAWQVSALHNGEPISFRLSQHERRDEFMQSLAAALPDGPISGLCLKAYPGQGGNKFVTLEPA